MGIGKQACMTRHTTEHGCRLVIAHRLSTIQHADNIIVLQNGEILEQGNHQALLKKKGHYYKLYQLQYADQEA